MQIVERKDRSITIDGIVDREIRSRNFKGEEKRNPVTGTIVNNAGRRNFLLYLPEDIAEELKDRGCEVKYTKLRDPNDVATPFIQIAVSYFIKPVDVVIRHPNGNRVQLDEAHVSQLDSFDFRNVCLVLEFGKEKVHPSNGVKYIPVFASSIFCDITPNYFSEKYGGYNTQGAAPVPPTPSGSPDGEIPF